ncbi:hypothetical protein C8T65DRAFT_724342 [Cerioporus squamosus]|nr:hypothetical protein C8T65DRAFT_724342 [Cerioporus squamosus]
MYYFIDYYFIDFGISSHFEPDDTNRLVTGTKGLDEDVPELSADVPYDPFKVDIFILGNLFYGLFFAFPPSKMADAASLHSCDDSAFVEFAPAELYWRGKQELLYSNGYDLRPRFRPGWIPFWRLDPSVDLFDAEDHLTFHPAQTHLMNARRISDGKLVLIKKVARKSREVHIATLLSCEELRRDARNHCVPVLDVLDGPEDHAVSFLVMPFLRNIDDPEFDTIGSILAYSSLEPKVCRKSTELTRTHNAQELSVNCATSGGAGVVPLNVTRTSGTPCHHASTDIVLAHLSLLLQVAAASPGPLAKGVFPDVFMHEHNVAHRDCAYRNVLVDATVLYPEGFHPIADLCLPDQVTKPAPVLPRSTLPVIYYYIDFGISTLFAPDDLEGVVGYVLGQLRNVPVKTGHPGNQCISVDVFIPGNLFRKSFLESQKFANVGMLAPLASRMTAQELADRPSAMEALQHFRQIDEDVWTVRRLWRTQLREEPYAARPILDMVSLLNTLQEIVAVETTAFYLMFVTVKHGKATHPTSQHLLPCEEHFAIT